MGSNWWARNGHAWRHFLVPHYQFSQEGKWSVSLGFVTLHWVDWWTVFLGLGFVLATLYAPKGIGGLVDQILQKELTDAFSAT